MMKVHFDEEELIVLALFDEGNRSATIASLDEVMPELEEDSRDDPEMMDIVQSMYGKLQELSDEEYDSLDLEAYRFYEDDEYSDEPDTDDPDDYGSDDYIEDTEEEPDADDTSDNTGQNTAEETEGGSDSGS